jgi:hypothetical protein
MTAFTAGDIISPLISAYIYDLYRFSSFNIMGITFGGFAIPFFTNATLGVISITLLLSLIKEPKNHTRYKNIEPEDEFEKKWKSFMSGV